MALRTINDPIDSTGVLTALGAVMVPNTQFEAGGGVVLVNTWSPLELGQVGVPALVLEAMPQRTVRQGWRTWQNELLARAVYLDRWDQQNSTLDQIWQNLDLDLHRMKSNIEDNPTLTVGGVVHALKINKIELSAYAAQKDDRFALVAMRRTMTCNIHLPLYNSVF